MIKKVAKKNNYREKNLIVSKTKNISKDIGSSNAIFGMKSFGLFISLHTKKKVYGFQKNKRNFKLLKKSNQL
jgi:hypothetical protein